MRRRTFLTGVGLTGVGLGGLASAGLARMARAASAFDRARLAFLDHLPAYVPDDSKRLLGWVADAAAIDIPLQKGEIVDRRSGFSTVPGFAAPTPLGDLAGRYRLLRPPYKAHDYYGMIFGLLDEDDTVRAVIVANRLFRLPVILQEPLGLGADLWANAGLLLGFQTAALGAALTHADLAWEEATRLKAPLIALGQSQAGGTAQLQIAHLRASGATAGRFGFITFNANCSPAAIRRLKQEPAQVPGVNFAKDLDPGLGPHSLLANNVGLQVYIHADGSGGLTPQSSYWRAFFHPRQHFLDSFNDVSLATALRTALG
jgi:hypothetical protein